MISINTRRFGGMYAEVTVELGPPHNQIINLGTFEHDALQRLVQEIEHDLDWMKDAANNLTPNERQVNDGVRESQLC